MGWEAIEKYELEKQEIEQLEREELDQEVPELVDFLTDESESMLMDETSQLKGATDFLTEELSFSTLAPVQFTKTTEDGAESPEHSPVRNSSPEYTDLDRAGSESPQDLSFYNDFAKQGLQNAPAKSDYHYTQVTSEQLEWDRLGLEVIFRDQMEEIQTACQALGMLPDPTYWSPENVRQWILWQCNRYNLTEPNVDYLYYLTGLQLCQLSEDDFKMCAPASGTNLYWRLFNWKTVVEQMQIDVKPQLQHIPVPTCFPGSPGSMSPASTGTDDDTDQESLTGSSDVKARIAKAREEDWLPEEPAHHHHRQTIQLWQFLKQLLLQPELYGDCIKWVDRPRGIFKIENSTRVAKLWGKRKNRPAMNYDKLSRSIRQYYKKKIIMKPEITKRLVYQFCKEYL